MLLRNKNISPEPRRIFRVTLKRGQWKEVHNRGERGAGWVVYECPFCGKPGQVPPGVHILRDGCVDRHLTCLHCDTTAFLLLDKWDGGHRVKLFTGNEAVINGRKR
jgi:hypothetical protein